MDNHEMQQTKSNMAVRERTVAGNNQESIPSTLSNSSAPLFHSHHALLQLQRIQGNNFVQRMLSQRGAHADHLNQNRSSNSKIFRAIQLQWTSNTPLIQNTTMPPSSTALPQFQRSAYGSSVSSTQPQPLLAASTTDPIQQLREMLQAAKPDSSAIMQLVTSAKSREKKSIRQEKDLIGLLVQKLDATTAVQCLKELNAIKEGIGYITDIKVFISNLNKEQLQMIYEDKGAMSAIRVKLPKSEETLFLISLMPLNKYLKIMASYWDVFPKGLFEIIKLKSREEVSEVIADRKINIYLKSNLSKDQFAELYKIAFKGKYTNKEKQQIDEAASGVQGTLSGYVNEKIENIDFASLTAFLSEDQWENIGIFRKDTIQNVGGEEREAKVHGVTSPDKTVWIRKSLATKMELIHEYIHVISNGAVRKQSVYLNEGMTQYFAEKVCSVLKISSNKSGDAYLDQTNLVEKIVRLVGEQVVAEAYFKGNVKALEEAIKNKKGYTGQDWGKEWRTFISNVNNSVWKEAEKFLP